MKKSFNLPKNAIKFDGLNFDDVIHSAYAGVPHRKIMLGPGFDYNRILKDFDDCIVYHEKVQARPFPQEVFIEIGQDIGIVHMSVAFNSMSKTERNLPLAAIVLHGVDYDRTQAIANDIVKKYHIEKPESEKSKPNFYIITRNARGALESRKVRFPFQRIGEEEKVLLYGNDFIEWEKRRFIPSLSGSRGLHILQGKPGTGKTSLIKNWISEFRTECNFYYVPINLFPMLYSPEAIPLWLDAVLDGDDEEDTVTYNTSNGVQVEDTIITKSSVQRRRVFIIEDAENIIARREQSNQDEISNLLNLSDGLLGEALSAHLILTVNCKVEEIDPAVLRRGRLSGIWKFEEIQREQAIKLARLKGIDTRHITDAKESTFTLSSIFNSSEEEKLDSKNDTRMGFKR